MSTRTISLLAALVLILSSVACDGSTPEPNPGPTPEPEAKPAGPRVKILETDALMIDSIFPSMEGPSGRVPVDTSDIDWITAYKTEVVLADSGEAMGDEFFCHSQLQLPNTTRLLVTATGADEIRFPEGFGMPVNQILSGLPPSGRALSFFGMVLNNHAPEIHRKAKVRATIEYMTREDVGTPPRLRKLYKVGLPMAVEDLEAYGGGMASGAPGTDEDVSTACVLVEGLKGHWMVPPGPQKTRRRFENLVPVDATVHMAVVHLHNHGRYLRLNNVTTGETLWQSDVVYEEAARVQIETIPTYSSSEGFPLYTDHVYEIEAYYDNTTTHDVDAMALLDLYYHPMGNENITYAADQSPS